MLKKILIGTILIGVTSVLNAGTTSGGYGACISKAYYDEWNATDKNGMAYLIKSGKCIIMKKGVEYSMVDRGFGSSIIRVYIGGDSIKLWTANENIR